MNRTHFLLSLLEPPLDSSLSTQAMKPDERVLILQKDMDVWNGGEKPKLKDRHFKYGGPEQGGTYISLKSPSRD